MFSLLVLKSLLHNSSPFSTTEPFPGTIALLPLRVSTELGSWSVLLLGKLIAHQKVTCSELYPYCCVPPPPPLSAIGPPPVSMARMTKICRWRLRPSGRNCGGWQTTPVSGYACGTSTRLLRSWAACVSSTLAVRNRRPNWSYCNRP